MQRVYVLDTGALLSTWTQKNPDVDFVTIPAVLSELRNRPSQTRAQTLISTGRLREETPAIAHTASVRKAASNIGDIASLSENDIELLALALSKMEAGYLVTVVSTDLSLLNTAHFLGFDLLDIASRLTHQIRWTMRCPACDHIEDQVRAGRDCPVCGTPMRRTAAQKKPIQ